jgi:predicted permease
LTYGLWQSLFHGDPAVIGKTLRLDNVTRQVVGVLPAGFQFPSAAVLPSFRHGGGVASAGTEPVLFFPVAFDMSQFAWDGNYGNFVSLGRLNPGVSVTQAEAQLNAATAQLLQEMPQAHDRRPGALTASVEPMQEAMVGNSKTGLWLLMVAVMGLMLLACLNLANAQLGRALARGREAAVRTALGAARGRLIWSSLSENLLLAASGGASGVMLAYGGLELLRRSSPVNLPRLAEVHLNVTVLVFSMVVTCAASIVAGILPALRLLAADPQGSLQQGARAVGSRQSHAVRQWLVGLQVCGCTLLLLVTGLFSRSLLHLLREDKGFDAGQVTVAEVRLNPQAYPKDYSRASFDEAVLQNLRAIPGVQTAALVSAMPLDGESWIEPVQRVDRRHLETPLINFRWASPGYFEATRQRLVAGRFLEERDRDGHGTVLTEGEAKALWGNEDPIGGQVRIEGRVFTVVGVVADSRTTSLKTPAARMAYVHYKDRVPFATFFLVRTAQTPAAVAAAMREAIWKYDPETTVGRVKSLDAQMADSLATERFQTEVLAAFGTAALLLAMLGIYGVLSYSVATRRQEIGVRMALGARRSSVYALTFGEAAVPIGVGIAAGLAASIVAGRTIRDLLYGVQAIDPAVIAMVVVLFLASAAAAAYLPARRAASVDPMEALRAE